ncbi:MAG: hypothetical protein A2X86_15425 [Bdellovibrionales bacterium GWA2_49_15]|nr:MAG: hypothetical protein A2X86_15425 [Bdellovibrionales bacterium GWA2_49_15]HAZ14520.1 hypothetical protein [Bdellovibrionales bacterium]
MKFLCLILFSVLSLNLQAQSEEELPGLLKAELQELVQNSKEVEVNLPEEQVASQTSAPETAPEISEAIVEEVPKIEETISAQAAAPVREEEGPSPKHFSRSRTEPETPAETSPVPRLRQRGR